MVVKNLSGAKSESPVVVVVDVAAAVVVVVAPSFFSKLAANMKIISNGRFCLLGKPKPVKQISINMGLERLLKSLKPLELLREKVVLE